MKEYNDSSKLVKDIKYGKIREGEMVALNERAIRRNTYILSDGNMQVLETIPRMMEVPEFNIELRKLTIKFLIKHGGRFPNPWRRI